MHELVLTDGTILTFDGRVIEFFCHGSSRMHVKQIVTLEVTERRKGAGRLVIESNGNQQWYVDFRPEERQAVEQLVTAIQTARGST